MSRAAARMFYFGLNLVWVASLASLWQLTVADRGSTGVAPTAPAPRRPASVHGLIRGQSDGLHAPAPAPVGSRDAEVSIRDGMTADEIADLLNREGVIPNAREFAIRTIERQVSRRLLRGSYRFELMSDPERVIDRLIEGERAP